MKKILYLFLTVSLIFSSCKKEEDDVVTPTVISGCMDANATNYNANATNDDASCLYDLTGVWETTTAVLNGTSVFPTTASAIELHYFNDAATGGGVGTVGTENYNSSGTLVYWGEWNINSSSNNSITLGGTVYDNATGEVFLTGTFSFNIDFMTSYNNMTWRYVDYPNPEDVYVKTLVKSTTYSLSDW